MNQMTVLSPGLLSTLQDEGRFGYMDTGFSPGGAMDVYSLRTANILVGNAPGDGAIEMTLVGMRVQFHCTGVIALTGGDMEPDLNGKPIPSYAAVAVQAGDILTLKTAVTGMRTYLAVAGGFDIPPVMGSMSTNLKCALGGFQGRKLRAGDVLPLRQSVDPRLIGPRRTEPEMFGDPVTLRVLPGPQADYFTPAGMETFLSALYRVSEKSDRMGVRLTGEKIENRDGVDILSDGIATGSVQIPAAGTPIIMTADRQTTGGYAKIATVITPDLGLIAQAAPGTGVRFRAVTEKEAVRALRAKERALRALQYRVYFAK